MDADRKRDRSTWTREMSIGHDMPLSFFSTTTEICVGEWVDFDLHLHDAEKETLPYLQARCFPSGVRENHVIDGFGRPCAEQESWRVEPSIMVLCWIKLLSSANCGGTKSKKGNIVGGVLSVSLLTNDEKIVLSKKRFSSWTEITTFVLNVRS